MGEQRAPENHLKGALLGLPQDAGNVCWAEFWNCGTGAVRCSCFSSLREGMPLAVTLFLSQQSRLGV